MIDNHSGTDEYISQLRAHGGDDLADAFEAVQNAYYADVYVDDELLIDVSDSSEIDIMPHIEYAVWFGTVWGMEDPFINNGVDE